MKRGLLYGVTVGGLVAFGGYYLYQTLVPEMIAETIVSDSIPSYVPKRFESRVEALSRPINEGTEAVVEEMHNQGIPMDELMDAIDKTTEQQVDAFLNELTRQKPGTTDEVFDIMKKYVPSDFDAEVLRKPFTEHVDMKQIEKIIGYANDNRKTHDLDFQTTKAVLKKIILEKEEELMEQKKK